MKIVHVVGARPNFVKLAPLYFALKKEKISQKIIHTGQHYDENMSSLFFKDFCLPEPDINLKVGSSSHAQQTGKIMIKLEKILLDNRPDRLLVYGDCNSTLAAALTAVKLDIPVAHVEAGLRSFDRQMPEEINRLLVDQIADLLFTPSEDANKNLQNEGVSKKKIKFVGNIMIDTLVRLLPRAKKTNVKKYFKNFNRFVLVTLHRPRNVDNKKMLGNILKTLNKISFRLPVIFPVHPRTQKNINKLKAFKKSLHLHFFKPLGYLEFLNLERQATLVITDSGGIQEETTFLGVCCFTLRHNTERPITVKLGTNIIINLDYQKELFKGDLLEKEIINILEDKSKKGKIPPLWDGKTAERIIKILK